METTRTYFVRFTREERGPKDRTVLLYEDELNNWIKENGSKVFQYDIYQFKTGEHREVLIESYRKYF